MEKILKETIFAYSNQLDIERAAVEADAANKTDEEIMSLQLTLLADQRQAERRLLAHGIVALIEAIENASFEHLRR